MPWFCRFKLLLFIFMFLYANCSYFSVSKCDCSPFSSTITRQTLNHIKSFYNEENLNLEMEKIEINCQNLFQICILCFGSVIMLWLYLLHLCNDVRYITYNLNIKKKSILKLPQYIWMYLLLMTLGFLLCDCSKDQNLLFIICSNPNFARAISLALKFCRIISWTIFGTLSIFIFSMAVTPATFIVCLMAFQICCHSCKKMYHIGCQLFSLYCQMVLI